jgi:transcriptional regulator with XRE-family HTH domain
MREQAYTLRLRGLTLRQIADEIGCSNQHVHTLLREEIAERLDPLKDQYLQYELDRLDHMQQAVLTVLDNPVRIEHVAHWDGTYETNDQGERFKRITMVPVQVVDDRKILGAVDRLVRISESRRKLTGLDAPVKVQADVQVTETTQEDLELQELIREAKAKAAASAEALRATSPEAGW